MASLVRLTAIVLLLFSLPLRADTLRLHLSTAGNLTGATAQMLNGLRKQNRLKPVKPHPAVMKAAQAHADWLRKTGKTGHEGKGGSRPKDRLRKTGLRSCLTAENNSFGYPSFSAAFAGWAKSPRHRSNMLQKQVTVFGIGQAGDIFVLVLAQPC